MMFLRKRDRFLEPIQGERVGAIFRNTLTQLAVNALSSPEPAKHTGLARGGDRVLVMGCR